MTGNKNSTGNGSSSSLTPPPSTNPQSTPNLPRAEVCEGMKVGKILIQRDESTEEKVARLIYSKLPGDIADLRVLLVDPMLATGGSALKAIEVLEAAGVKQENIVFLNVVSCPEGLARLQKEAPGVFVITAEVDEKLNEEKYIVPGLGDFGDRYYST